MSLFTVQRVEQLTDAQIDAFVALFVLNMKDDPSALSLSGGDPELIDPMVRAMVQAGRIAGEYYTATDVSGELLGYALWMPPGQQMFSTSEQREAGLNDFMGRISQKGRDYFHNEYLVIFREFAAKCLGSTKIIDTWYLHILMVRADKRKQGIARALVNLVVKQATQNGEVLALTATKADNVPVYKALGFELKGERIMPSPWQEYPVYIFHMDTRPGTSS
ncbi:hypothetical protein CERSUDRAFT_119274 [Gelatoporia subvermispora B]|uniref:N-acetyltransferase domain-containing protein n=1 Tax=Ceriporiopsis subvermispora (strain B) TaxID=914234 RepID=M2QZH3_CERS8|nr:hypothetical protein CERSUDRAFT_119274 [Gelatoporia subvermispora B]